MTIQVIRARKRLVLPKPAIIDILLLIGDHERQLLDPDKTVSEHALASEALRLLTDKLHNEMTVAGFADPVFIKECVAQEVNAVLDARKSLSDKLKQLRASPTAYYSAQALRFDENYKPPLTWPSDNPSSDAD